MYCYFAQSQKQCNIVFLIVIISVNIFCVVLLVSCLDADQRGSPRNAPSGHFVNPLDEVLSITQRMKLLVSHWLMGKATFLLANLSRPQKRGRPAFSVTSHFATPFLLGSSRVQKIRIRSKAVTFDVISFDQPFELSSSWTACCPPPSDNVLGKPSLGHAGGQRRRKTGGFPDC